MDIPFFKVFAVFGIVSSWATRALADGKVTLTEALQLVSELATLLGVESLFELPGPDAEYVLKTLDANTDPESVDSDPTGYAHLKQGKDT